MKGDRAPAPQASLTSDRIRQGREGRPLPADIGRTAARGLGADLSRVRIHDDAAAAQTAAELGARAVTVGTDIAFGSGEYRPQDPAGRHLLMHELAHVAQQPARAGTGGPVPLLAAEAPQEREAERAAGRLMQSGGAVRLTRGVGAFAARQSRELRQEIAGLTRDSPLTDVRDGELRRRYDRLGEIARGRLDAAERRRINATQRRILEELAARSLRTRRTFTPQSWAAMRTYLREAARRSARGEHLECINVLRVALGRLYGGMTNLGPTRRNTIDELMPRLRTAGMSTAAREIQFLSSRGNVIRRGSGARPARLQTSLWDTVVQMAGNDVGYSVFALSVADGHHSVILGLDMTTRGQPRIHWGDQTARHGPGFEEYARTPGRGSSVQQYRAGTRRSLDEYIVYMVQAFWDDEPANRKPFPILRVWRLQRPPPAAPAAPAMPARRR